MVVYETVSAQWRSETDGMCAMSAEKSGNNSMGNRDQHVMGYGACASPTDGVCPGAAGDAGVMSGSTQAMTTFLAEIDPQRPTSRRLKKTRWGDMLRGFTRGAASACDEESYARLSPRARKEGLPVAGANVAEMPSKGVRCFTVQWQEREHVGEPTCMCGKNGASVRPNSEAYSERCWENAQ